MAFSVEGADLVISGKDEGGETWSYRGNTVAALKKSTEEGSQAKMGKLKGTHPYVESE
jgi:hypothetical protein